MKKEISYLETLQAIDDCKRRFEIKLESDLGLTKVQSPIFVKSSTGLQDNLNGIEKPVSFTKDDEEFEIVHSLAKWKRVSLGKYQVPKYQGIYTDMKAIRKDEEVDEIHSIYVEQWDWEKVIGKQDRNIDYLKETVDSVYNSIRETLEFLKKKYDYLSLELPEKVYYITSQELEDMYPEKTPKEREQIIGKEKKAVFIIGIGGELKSGKVHDNRSPDYDDWKLNGDLLIYDKCIDRTIEISSMGIRVDKESLKMQLEKSDCMDRMSLPYHKKIMQDELPYTIGGGIGQSRILMLLLEKEHIAEVQATSWEKKYELQFKNMQVL